MSIVRYLIIFTLTGLVVIGASLLWSKFTTKPQPQALSMVREQVLKTNVGQNIAAILGISDGGATINVSSLTASVAGALSGAVTQKTQQIITTQIIDQLSNGYDELPQSQKQQLQQIICKTQ